MIENTDVREYYYPAAAVTLTEDENLVYTEKWPPIYTYIMEMVQKFVMGVESLDNIDDFYAELKAMGYDECIEIQRAAYARFLGE